MIEERERLTDGEAEGWARLNRLVDRIAPDDLERPGAGPDGWTPKDVLWHLRTWAQEAADQLAAIRTGTYRPREWETDAINARALQEGRARSALEVRIALERSRARFLAEWSAVTKLSGPAVEWFGESGEEHYAEHLADLEPFVERVGGETDPEPRRQAKLLAEEQAWREIDDLVDAVPLDRLQAPGVTPDGWSVKDTMWHVARWCEDCVDAFGRMRDGTFDDGWGDDEEVDALNAAWFAESRDLDVATVRTAWYAQRAAMVRGFATMPVLTPTIEEWFDETATLHYEKHLIDLRRWLGSTS